ncbi:GDSL-type esterase/lipase family protein [Microbacterium hibisci]|uniref:GDSL-type esterase/lipase family protein n=1 Tax=Microbacterium hibisci TaxID=2036000 RepID=UPI0019423185|nr:GDSL-type esterase/lipase family protein [Microbacterium hibisci]
MRVALLAESFLPHMNGVTGSVLHVLRHLAAEGHETLVIAPRAGEITADLHGARTELLRSVPLPSYPEVRVVFARAARLTAILHEFRPDVVHLASPFVLGWQGLAAADVLRIPSVAVYQTDVVAYAERYGMPQAAALAGRHIARLHRRATLTLAPSTASLEQLEALGVDRLRRWGRGVDTGRFRADRRSDAWRARIAPGLTVVGYVGRLAPEKQVEDLAALADVAGTRLVIVGDGPARPALERALPDAVFTGHLDGDALAEALASFDVFVHPGESETFGQTIQEALASGVPVVATGTGGPVDLVRSSVDGWLYRPGDLGDLRARVADLAGDEGKRRAFAAAASESVRDRSWDAVCRRLMEHYDEARALRPIDDAQLLRASTRPAAPPRRSAPARPWSRFVALGDSITEGLCDASRMPSGEYRGWADRLAQLLAHAQGADEPFRYANLAVRSRRVQDVLTEQLPVALALRPDLVSILIGANDLVARRVDPVAVAAGLENAVRRLRASGIDVLLVTPFLPRRRAALLFARRFAVFSSELRRIAAQTGAVLLDTDAVLDARGLPAIGDLELWADDKVHLRPRGHRYLAYRAAETLGVPDAEALGDLDAVLHADDDPVAAGTWLRRDALPWVWRRLRGRTAGDGLVAKHADYVLIGGRGDVPARVHAG